MSDFNSEVLSVFALVRGQCVSSLVNAGVRTDDQRWSMCVEGDVLSITGGVGLLVGRQVFWKALPEALRSRVVRACRRREVVDMGWVVEGSKSEVLRDVDLGSHLATVTVTLRKRGNETGPPMMEVESSPDGE